MNWAQSIYGILTSSNALLIVCGILLILIILIKGIKEGYLRFNKAGINVGNADKERNIIRQQIEYAHTYLTSLENELEVSKSVDKWRVKYVIERVYDEVVDWISFNHITDKGDYIQIKQDKVWYLVQSFVYKPEFQSTEFRLYCDEAIRHIIVHLIKIRVLYK